ncbi:MAG: hypothetical protein NVSMB14_01960 [Isosphaeraceae bacterium]
MTTLTVRDDERIVFETTYDDRMEGSGYMLLGTILAMFGMFCIREEHGRLLSVLIGVLLCGLGIASLVFGLSIVIRYERLTLNLSDRTYDGERNWQFGGETWSGPFEDFDHVGLVAKYKRARRSSDWVRYWVVEWVWRDERKKPLKVSIWAQAPIFTQTLPPARDARLEFLRSLRNLAETTGVPFHVPLDYLEMLGIEPAEFAG